MASPVVEVLAALDAALQSIGVRWYLFGAQAAILHGAARLTADVDATIGLGDRPVAALVEALVREGFTPRVDEPAAFVARARVLPAVHVRSGMGVDLVVAGTEIQALFFERSQRQTMEGVSMPVASAEDVVIMKILAGRPRDLDDASAILAAQGTRMGIDRCERCRQVATTWAAVHATASTSSCRGRGRTRGWGGKRAGRRDALPDPPGSVDPVDARSPPAVRITTADEVNAPVRHLAPVVFAVGGATRATPEARVGRGPGGRENGTAFVPTAATDLE
jgi:hypothetical protein